MQKIEEICKNKLQYKYSIRNSNVKSNYYQQSNISNLNY